MKRLKIKGEGEVAFSGDDMDSLHAKVESQWRMVV
jgi:hypothetical protein